MTGWMSSPYIKGTVVHLAPPERAAEEEGYRHRDDSSSNADYADKPPPTEEEDDLYSVSTYAVNEDGNIMSPQEAMSRASSFRSGAGETLPTTTTPTASRPRHLHIPDPPAENAMSPGGGSRSPRSPARSPLSEAWRHHPSEALETPPSYDCPPEYEPTFQYDKADKYRYSLAQKDRWQLHDPLREGDPNWDNLNAKDPNVLEESREVQKYRKAKAKAEDRKRRESERLERIGADPSGPVGGGSGGGSASTAGRRRDNEIGFGGVNRQMSAQGQREAMLWGSSVGMGGARFE